MPEGPEVRVMYDYLVRYVGSTLIGIVVSDKIGDLGITIPSIIWQIYIHGKHIYMYLSCYRRLHFTFALTGRIQVSSDEFVKAEFHTSIGNFYYRNPRCPVGTIESIYYQLPIELPRQPDYGPDILQEVISYDVWAERLWRRSKSEIEKALVNQKFVAGIGNYLKSEILYEARINPYRRVSSLNQEEVRRLYHWANTLIRESYRHGGLSIQDYLNPLGFKGTFPKKVYHCDRDPYGNQVTVTVTKKGGQSTFWVPQLQL